MNEKLNLREVLEEALQWKKEWVDKKATNATQQVESNIIAHPHTAQISKTKKVLDKLIAGYVYYAGVFEFLKKRKTGADELRIAHSRWEAELALLNANPS